MMRVLRPRVLPGVVVLLAAQMSVAYAQTRAITTAGQPAQLDVRSAGEHSLRITLKPISVRDGFPPNPAVVARPHSPPALSLRELAGPMTRRVGSLSVEQCG